MSDRRALELRLAVPALTAWAVAAVLVGVPDAAWPVAAAGFAGALTLLVLRRWPTVAVACAAAALVAVAVGGLAPTRTPPELEAAADRAAPAELHVAVGAVTTAQADGPWSGAVVAVETADGWRAVDAPVLVFDAPTDAAIGTVLAVRASLQPAEPGDDRAYLAFTREVRGTVAEANGFLTATDDLRRGLAAAAAERGGDGGALLPGLAVGDTSAVAPDLEADMQAGSLTHLTAVSGANCAIVVGLVLLLGRALRLRRGIRIGAALVVLAGFVVLVTPEPSVLRAAVMAAVALGALASGRGSRGVPVLAASIVVLVALDPWIARSIAFVLSVAATGALLLLAGPLTERMARVLPRPVAAALAVPLAAQLVCQPVIVTLEPSLPVWGVLANLLAGPAAPVATIGGMIACLLIAVAPPLAPLAVMPAWLAAAWIGGVARVAADLPAATLAWPADLPGAALLALGTAGVLCALFVRRPRVRRVTAAIGVLALVLPLAAVAGADVVRSIGMPRDWTIAVCDVGQGDAVLLRSDGATMLVDAGIDPELVGDCLGTLGVRDVDVLVLTHFDADHVGGAAALVGRTRTVLHGPVGEPADAALLDALAAGGADVRQVAAGEVGALGEARWRVLWPPVRDGPEPGNDASVVLDLQAWGGCASGCPDVLLLGDLGEQAQRDLLRTGGVRPVEVVKVSHHGSADQSSELYARASATLGVIGVGENDYGHPRDELLDLLAASGTAVARTDLEGLVLVAHRRGELVVWTERAPPG